MNSANIIAIVLLHTLTATYSGDPFWRDPATGKGWYTVEEVDTRGNDGDYEDVCRTLHCRRGEECVVRDRVAVCQCRRTCPHTDRPACASDGITYPSHCHLHREACVTGKRLHAVRHGTCADTSDGNIPVLSTNPSPLNGTTAGSQHQQHSNTEPSATSPATTVGQTSSTEGPTSSASRAMDVEVDTSTRPPIPDVTTSLIDTTPYSCSSDDFIYVPSNLLLYFHAKYSQSGSGGPSEKGKSYLVHLIYNHLDLNADKILTKDELQQAEEDGKYTKLLPPGCHLTDLLSRADNDGDGRVNEREFFRLFGLPVAFISPHNSIKVHRVEVGKQYQLFCDIEKYNSASLKVTWYRYDVPLVNVAPYDFEVSADGSLYLTPASLMHNGNFSCRVPISVTSGPFSDVSEVTPNVLQQVHVVHVFEPVRVSVTPDFLLLKTGENGYLRCDVEGYPAAKITWEKNDRPFRDNVSVLQLTNVRSYDTGSYRCGVSSPSGMDAGNGDELAHLSASVVVRDRYDQPEMALRFNTRHHADSFSVFYESGVRLYRADDCSLLHAIPSSYPVPEEKQGYLCRDRRCRWSDALVTQPPVYMYATLPEQMALVKINLTSGGVEQVFHLNHMPMKLRYMEWEDTVWVEAWHDSSGNYKTVQTIRSASKTMRHSLTHALPLRDEFDAVHRVFLPTYGKLKYGYVTHWQERALHKIDLHSLKIVSRVSLVPYDCQPDEVAFVTQAGLAVVQCSSGGQTAGNRTRRGGQLILDCVSDAALGYDANMHGTPAVTEDGRWIVNIDTVLGRIFVHRVDEKGGPLVATIDEFLPINDWTLHPATSIGSWDLYAAPRSGADLIKINIPDANLERLTGVANGANRDKSVIAVSTQRRNRYLAGATSESVFVVDLYNPNSANCHIRLNGTEKIVWAI